MHLKDAQSKNKLAEFIAEREKTHPKASHKHFHAVVKSMAAGSVKPKSGTSKKPSSGR
jgi:hypothetical protein